MKMILAILPPDRLEAVKNKLSNIEVFRLTVMDVQGFGTIRTQSEPEIDPGRGREKEISLTRRVQVLIGVNDEFLAPTVEAIRDGVRSDENENLLEGKIFILPMDDCIRIRTGERGPEAI